MSKLLVTMLIPAMMLALPAHAAFEWIPPANTPSSSEGYRAAPIASPGDFEANMVPMPEKQPSAPVAQSASVTATKTATVQWENSPALPVSAPVTNQPANLTAAAPRPLATPVIKIPDPLLTKNPDMVEGFGRDVPLTIATRQIVPSSYVVQYGQGVDPNMSVTWSGGRLWKDALMDSLTEKNLKASIVGDTVLIESVVAPAPIAEPAPVQTPAPIVAQSAPTPLPPVAEVKLPPVADATQTAMADTGTAMSSPMQPATINDAAPALPVSQMWIAPRASTLRQILTDWCREANVQLQWSAQYDYPLMSDVQISGTFENAVETLLSGLVDAQPRPVARLHPNEPTGPAVLVVETRYILE